MSSGLECECCQDILRVLDKIEELEEPVACITEHLGFSRVCLDVWVLQTAYYHYQQDYGVEADPLPIHESVQKLKNNADS